MRFFIPFLLLFFSSPAIAQIQILLTVTKENGNKAIDTTFKDKNGAILDGNAAIAAALKQGGVIILKKGQTGNINFQLKKDSADAGLKLLTDAAINIDKDTVIPFDAALKIKKNKMVPDDRLINPDATLQNLVILFTENGTGLAVETIKVNEVISPFLPTPNNQGKNGDGGQNDKPNNDCDNCIAEFKKVSSTEIVLYYDFNCKTFFRLKSDGPREPVNVARLNIKNKQQIHLIIENVNRYVHDISIISNDITYESEMSPLFKNFFFGDSAKLLGTLMNSSLNSKDESLKSKFEAYKTALGTFNASINKLKALRLSAFLTCDNFKCCKEENITEEFETTLNALSNLRSSLFDLQVQALVTGTPEEVQKAIVQLKKEISDCAARQQTVDDLKKKRVALKPEETEAIKKADEDIKNAEKALCVVKDGEPTLQNQLMEKNQLLLVLKGIEALQAGLPSEDDVAKLFLFAKNVRKTYNRYIAPPIFVNGNALDLAIHIRPNDTSLVKKWGTNPIDNDSFSVEIPVLWKAFVSFSAGSYISIGKKLYNKTYDWQVQSSGNNSITDSSRFLLTESGYTPPAAGFAALVNMELKATPTLGIGFSIGVGLTIEKTPRMSYLAGGTLFLGDRRQLALTGGVSVMQINKLKNNLQAVADQKITYTYRPAIEYYKEFKTGGFISLTYTPFTFTSKIRSRSK